MQATVGMSLPQNLTHVFSSRGPQKSIILFSQWRALDLENQVYEVKIKKAEEKKKLMLINAFKGCCWKCTLVSGLGVMSTMMKVLAVAYVSTRSS